MLVVLRGAIESRPVKRRTKRARISLSVASALMPANHTVWTTRSYGRRRRSALAPCAPTPLGDPERERPCRRMRDPGALSGQESVHLKLPRRACPGLATRARFSQLPRVRVSRECADPRYERFLIILSRVPSCWSCSSCVSYDPKNTVAVVHGKSVKQIDGCAICRWSGVD